MEQVNYEKLLPDSPPEGLIQWMKDNGRFDNNYIVYKQAYVKDPLTGMNEKMVQCTCTACNETYYLPRAEYDGCANVYAPAPFGFENIVGDNVENVISGTNTLCPCCGSEAEAKHVGNIKRDKTVNEYWPISIHRVGNRLALLSWYVARHLSSNGSTKIFVNPWEAYVVEDRKLVKLVGYTRFMSSISWHLGWVQRQRFVDSYGKVTADGVYPFSADVLVGTSAENCKLDMYIKACKKFVYPVSYMNLWVKHKNVENLIVQGVGKIVNESIDKLNSPYYYGAMQSVNNIKTINWKEKKPNRMLGVSKEEFRLVKKQKWSLKDLNFYNSAKRYGIKPEDLTDCLRFGYYSVERLYGYSVNIMRTLRYLDKQGKKYPKQRSADIGDITDYWDMCKELNENLSDDNVRYPQNLVRAHDTATERIEYKKSEELQVQFDKRTEQLNKYNYESNGLVIRPAGSQFELVCEGKNLNHCVGGYAKRHAKGETAIFFIRHIDEPDVSYFTLEFDEKNFRVLQNRGKHNCERTDEVRAFEAEWLEHIKNLKKEKKKNGKRNSKTAA